MFHVFSALNRRQNHRVGSSLKTSRLRRTVRQPVVVAMPFLHPCSLQKTLRLCQNSYIGNGPVEIPIWPWNAMLDRSLSFVVNVFTSYILSLVHRFPVVAFFGIPNHQVPFTPQTHQEGYVGSIKEPVLSRTNHRNHRYLLHKPLVLIW
jgi:hypothetical protein